MSSDNSMGTKCNCNLYTLLAVLCDGNGTVNLAVQTISTEKEAIPMRGVTHQMSTAKCIASY